MELTHHYISALFPFAVQFAKMRVLIPVRVVLLVTLPEKRQRHPFLLQLLPNVAKIQSSVEQTTLGAADVSWKK